MTAPRTAFLEQLDDYDRIARRAALSYLRGSGVSSYVGVPAEDYLQRSGKGLRPALCLATCTAFGGDVEDALPSAAAIELFHTAFLVHDDVEDDSELRRGGPDAPPPVRSGTRDEHRRRARRPRAGRAAGQPVPTGAPACRRDLVGVRPHGQADGRRAGAGAGLAAGGPHRPDAR